MVDDGCQAADFDALAPGEVAFTGFGGCFLWRKAVNARRAGAGALRGSDRHVGARRGQRHAGGAAARPAGGADEQEGAGCATGDRVQLSVDAVTERGSTQNVIAEIGPAPATW